MVVRRGWQFFMAPEIRGNLRRWKPLGLIKLPREKRNEIGQWLQKEIDIAITARSELDSQLDKYYQLFEMTQMRNEKNWPWKDASNVFVPITQDKCDSLTARIIASGVKNDPLWTFRAETPEGERYAPLLESYFKSKTHKLQYRLPIMEAVALAVRDGSSFLEVTRQKETEYTTVFGYDVEGNLKLRKESTVIFNDSVVKSHRLRDTYLIPAYAPSIEEAFGVFTRFWLRPHTAKEGIYNDIFYNDILDVAPPGVGERAGYVGSGLEDTSDNRITMQEHMSEEVGEWECFSIVIKYDINNNGRMVLCRFVLQKRDGILLAAEEYPYQHKKLNYIPLYPIKRTKSPYGISLVGRLEGIQREANADRNQRRDNITIKNAVPFKRLANSPTKLDSKPFGPAQVFDVNDMNDWAAIALPPLDPAIFAEERGLFELADRLAAETSFPMNKDATAREVQASQASNIVKFDLVMQYILHSISLIGTQLFELEKQYSQDSSEGVVFYEERNGQTIKQIIPPEAFQYDYVIRANGNFVTFDKEKRRQDLLFLYDLLLKNPLLVGIPNMMPPNLQRIYNLTRYVMQEWDVKDIESMIGKEEEYAQQGGGQQFGAPGALAGIGGNGGMEASPPGVPDIQALLNNPALLPALGR